MKRVLWSFIFLCFVLGARAQKNPKPFYKTGVGARFFPLGFSVKSMTNQRNGFEVVGYFREGFRVTGLYERHGILNEAQNLKWYIGGGAHVGFANKENGSDVKLGIDGVIGLDYKFLRLPLNISLDWQPSLGLGDGDGFIGNWGGIGVRFTL